MMWLFLGVCAFVYVSVTLGFPSGAPPDVCSVDKLTPIHGGHSALPGPSPYTLTASSSSYTSGKPITVTLKGPAGKSFKGFAIQARDSSGNFISSGEWSGNGMKQLPCGAATHTNDVRKTKVELTWTPKGSGTVTFLAIVVERFDSFYTNIKSISRGGSSVGSSGSSSSAATSASTALNSFYDRHSHKVRPGSSSSSAINSRPTATNNWELDYDSHPIPTDIKDNDEVSATPDQHFSSFHSSHFSQPDVGSSATTQDDLIGPGSSFFSRPQHQLQQQQQHQLQQQQHPQQHHHRQPPPNFFNNPYRGQSGQGGFHRPSQIALSGHHHQPHRQDGFVQGGGFQDGFAGFPAQSAYSHRFSARPQQGGFPFPPPRQQQRFRAPWSQYQHQF